MDGDVQPAYTEAQSWVEEAVTLCRRMGHFGRVGLALTRSSVLAHGLGDRAEAMACLREAARIGAKTGSFPIAVRVLPAMAFLLADEGEVERAVEHYALASRYGYVANSRWFEDVFGRQIADAAAGLSPEMVAASEERGRERDLQATMKELLVELEPDHGA